MVGLILSDDLLDASRVIGHGRANGVAVTQCRDMATLLTALERGATVVFLDLHNPGLEIGPVVARLKELGTRAIAFGSHVDVARLKAARAAGCEEVLPRSAFFENLDAILAALVEKRTPVPPLRFGEGVRG